MSRHHPQVNRYIWMVPNELRCKEFHHVKLQHCLESTHIEYKKNNDGISSSERNNDDLR